MERIALLEFAEAELGWKGDLDDLNLRISHGEISNLKLKEKCEFKIIVEPKDCQLHFLIQTKNLAIASFSISLMSLTNGNYADFEKIFELIISKSVMKLLGFEGDEANMIKIKIIGNVTLLNSQKEDKNIKEINSYDEEIKINDMNFNKESQELEIIEEKIEEKDNDLEKYEKIEYEEEEEKKNDEKDVIEEEKRSEENIEEIENEDKEKIKIQEQHEEKHQEEAIKQDRNIDQESESKKIERKNEEEPLDYLDDDFEKTSKSVELLPTTIQEFDNYELKSKFKLPSKENLTSHKRLPPNNEAILNQQSISLDLSNDSIKSVCPYIDDMRKCEFHVLSVSQIIENIKQELGLNFQKLLIEQSRRESATPKPRRNTRKTTTEKSLNTSKQSECSEISFISTTKVEENAAEIPSIFDLSIENLSINHSALLTLCIVSLLAKLTQYEVDVEEIPSINELINNQDLGIEKIEEKLISNQHDFETELISIKTFKDDIKERISAKRKILEIKKKERIEKENEKMNIINKVKQLKECRSSF